MGLGLKIPVPTLCTIQQVLRPSSSRAHQHNFQIWFAHGTALRLQSEQRWEHLAGLRANFRQSSHNQALLELFTKHYVQVIRFCNLGHLREVSQHWLSELHPQLLLKFSFKPLMYFCFIHVASVLYYYSFGIRQRVCMEYNFHTSVKLLLYSFTFSVFLYPSWSLSLIFFSLISPCELQIHR